MSANPRSADTLALSVDGVSKSFPRRRPVGELLRRPFASNPRTPAVRGVSLAVAPGELVGLLGPNGAGKTTLLKMICGLVVPDAGDVLAFGRPVTGPELSRLVGLVHGDERSFYWRLTARENLEFFARLYGMDRATRAEVVARLLERVDLARDAERRFGDFSSGMKQRMAIARALLADPPLLLMDEPTRSLDPVSAASLREWVKDELHRRDGKAIVLATHNLREAELLCDRVVVLARGEVRADGTPEALRRRGLGGVVYRFVLRGTECAPPPGATLLESEPQDATGTRTVVLRFEHDGALDGALEALRAAGQRIVNVAPQEPDLETVFRGLVERAAAEGDAP